MGEYDNSCKEELHTVLNIERAIYFTGGLKYRLSKIINCDERYLFMKYLCYLRCQEYYMDQTPFASRFLRIVFTRKKNKLGNLINVKIIPHAVGIGVNIHHKNVIINRNVGDNAIFHGNNCIGNNTMSRGDNSLLLVIIASLGMVLVYLAMFQSLIM